MTYNEWFIKQNLLSEAPYFMGELAWNEQQIIINRLQMALADTEALELGTTERLEKVTVENERLRDTLEAATEFIERHSESWDRCGQRLLAQCREAVIRRVGDVK